MYQDSTMGLIDPGCVVKKPEQPKEFYDLERQVEARAESVEVKASGLSGGDLAMVKERATALLQGSTPSDASGSEKSAVSARAKELKPLLGFAEPPPAPNTITVERPTPKPAAAPTGTQVTPEMSAAAQKMGACMTKNMQTHQREIEALAEQAQAAQKAGDQAKLMAIADTVQRIQMAGCVAGR
jgi:hypothetical protein